MNSRRIPLIVGLVLALGTGILMLNYLTQARGTSAATVQRAVVITTKEIAARARITPDMLAVVQRAADQVDSDALADAHLAAGQIALITLPAGSTVTHSKIATPVQLALPTRLRSGLRAVSISIDKVKGVSGLIQPGDRVDVIAIPPRAGSETPKATTILRGALVLAMGNTTESASATPSPDNQNLTTVTLAVTPKQADLVALADTYTTLRLALRSSDEPVRSQPVEQLELGGVSQPAAAPAAAPAPAVAPAAAAPAPVAAQPNVMQAPPAAAQARSTSGVSVVEGDHFAVKDGNAR